MPTRDQMENIVQTVPDYREMAIGHVRANRKYNFTIVINALLGSLVISKICKSSLYLANRAQAGYRG